MAYCQKCGNINPEDSKFCIYCGAAMTQVMPTAGYRPDTGYQPGTGYQQTPVYQQTQTKPKKAKKTLIIILAAAALLIAVLVPAVVKGTHKISEVTPSQATAQPAAETAQNGPCLEYTADVMVEKLLELVNPAVEQYIGLYTAECENGLYNIYGSDGKKVAEICFFDDRDNRVTGNGTRPRSVTVSSTILNLDDEKTVQDKARAYSLFSCAVVCVRDGNMDVDHFVELVDSDKFVNALAAPYETGLPKVYASGNGKYYDCMIETTETQIIFTFSGDAKDDTA